MLNLIGKIFGTENDRIVKSYRKKAEQINALENRYLSLSDEELQQEYWRLRENVQSGTHVNDVLFESFAITREASKRTLGMRHFDVQLIGGMVLNDGNIAEMRTGEGKTLVATLPVCLNALSGVGGIHVVTVNDYLAHRDAEIMRPLYEFLGLTVASITGEMDDEERLEAYECDVVYATNNELGFDYLRDNMKYSHNEQVCKKRVFAIVDEVDSILIDEARTPLIISGATRNRLENYLACDEIAKQLIIETHFLVDEKNRTVLLTEAGIAQAEVLFGVNNLYDLENAILAHQLDQALKANYLFAIDVDYVVREGEVLIVDEFTGRISEGRRFSEGLHQALEAKEKVTIKEESQTLASITYQNYFRLYTKLAGMTGTAQTEATEFAQIYNLDVVSIPTNVPVKRQDLNDLIYKTEEEKFEAVLKKIEELHTKGQPVLVGTASIERSEVVSRLLHNAKIPHTVLNAKNHESEAEIIKDAGLKGSVTVATNMAGRGVDIKITDEIKELGGLFILGTERHESRRIDNQLRGRSGRQGDPGVSQFLLSLEDNLLRIFGSDKIKRIMDRLGVERGEYIESGMVTRAVENAQKKVESLHFESRKHLLEYDDVANAQRKIIYHFRQELLNPDYDISGKIEENRMEYITHLLNECDIIDGFPAEGFNRIKLIELLAEETGCSLTMEEILGDAQEIYAVVLEKLSAYYKEKMDYIEESRRIEIEKIVYLQVMDEAWRNHLYQMDLLKTGIGLRGYNQKDPLVEYKKESYSLFTELVSSIKMSAIKMLHTLRLNFESEEEEDAAIEHAREQLAHNVEIQKTEDKQAERRAKYEAKKAK